MKKLILVTTLSLATASMMSCATHNMALEDARKSYQKASGDPMVAQNAPVELHDAGTILQKANQAQADHAKVEEVNHLASLASTRTQIAVMNAQKKQADSQFQNVSKERTNVVLSAREKEAQDARARADALEAQNKQLQDSNSQSQAQVSQYQQQSSDLAAKNAELAKQLSDLKMKPTSRGMELTLRDTTFATGKAELTSGAQRDLEKIANGLKGASDHKILIEGFTDSVGSDALNDSLSQKRAEAVKEVLAQSLDSSKITAKGLGKQYPIAPNTTAVGRAQNRRVTITVLAEKSDKSAQDSANQSQGVTSEPNVNNKSGTDTNTNSNDVNSMTNNNNSNSQQ